ncbi:hypothetical protein KU306_06880 [Haloferax larsenii]|uniref:DUF7981 domain-containing protein n=1 Tax=Haloferax larsenii TaxID=302484 RepID=A0ABY5RHG1_HALLR|nr:hypothetical protein [Haloferax larsenii]ELZ75183.1 hypothetical protein C455_16378 [Haloferax larsenii JCM 13917]UVE51594.1 hypothetical protein KU306_06880 [Haloferax larsenii]
MSRRRRSAIVWGLVSVLLVGVIAQTSILLGLGLDLSFETVAAVALVSGVVVASVTYVIEPRLERKGRA